MAITKCRYCDGKVSTDAKKCPHCNTPYPWRKNSPRPKNIEVKCAECKSLFTYCPAEHDGRGDWTIHDCTPENCPHCGTPNYFSRSDRFKDWCIKALGGLVVYSIAGLVLVGVFCLLLMLGQYVWHEHLSVYVQNAIKIFGCIGVISLIACMFYHENL